MDIEINKCRFKLWIERSSRDYLRIFFTVERNPPSFSLGNLT